MKAVNYLFSFFISAGIIAPKVIPGDDFCSIRNTTTQSGEEISYTVYYSLAGAYVAAGEASFTNHSEQLNGKTVYHVKGSGKSNAKYDWLYKVRDTYESYIDTSNMQPMKFVRDVSEGSHKKYESISFNRNVNTAITDSGVYKVPPCIQDVLSTIYYARNIDFSRYKPNDKIPFKMFLENEVHQLYLRYLGKEEIKTKYAKFKAVKFKTLLIPGTIFKGGEDMTVWVSDDANHVPVRIETEILIGSIKVDMTSYRNLRYPLSSLEKKKSK
jgi:hypothetical protein